jgi:hypothetical protein
MDGDSVGQHGGTQKGRAGRALTGDGTILCNDEVRKVYHSRDIRTTSLNVPQGAA